MTTDWQRQRVITVLKKYGPLRTSILQKHCSPYGMKKADLEPILESLKREGLVLEYPGTKGGRYFRWTGPR